MHTSKEEMVATQKPLLPTPQLKELGGLLTTPIVHNWHHQQTRDRFRNYSTYDGTADNYGNGNFFRPDYEPVRDQKVFVSLFPCRWVSCVLVTKTSRLIFVVRFCMM